MSSSAAPRRRSWRLFVLGVALALVVGGCGGAAPAVTSSVVDPTGSPPPALASPSPSTAPSPTPRHCPYQGGGKCLGPVAAGEYTSTAFQPVLTYRVPDGWSNFEDLAGNFGLLPPGGSVEGINADDSDFVGVYSTVALPNGCHDGEVLPDSGRTPADLDGFFRKHPGLDVTSREVTLGGRPGFVLDITMAKAWTKKCWYWPKPLVPMLIGVFDSGLEHNIGPGRLWRLYLLENGTATMAIEINLLESNRTNLEEYDAVVRSMTFEP